MKLRILAVFIMGFFASVLFGVATDEPDNADQSPSAPLFPKLDAIQVPNPAQIVYQGLHNLVNDLVFEYQGTDNVLHWIEAESRYFSREVSPVLFDLIQSSRPKDKSANPTRVQLSGLHDSEAFPAFLAILQQAVPLSYANKFIGGIIEYVGRYEVAPMMAQIEQYIHSTQFSFLETFSNDMIFALVEKVYGVSSTGGHYSKQWGTNILKSLMMYLSSCELAKDKRKPLSSVLDHFKEQQALTSTILAQLSDEGFVRACKERAAQQKQKSENHEKAKASNDGVVNQIIATALQMAGAEKDGQETFYVPASGADAALERVKTALSSLNGFEVSLGGVKTRAPIGSYQPPRNNKLGPWFLTSGFANTSHDHRRLACNRCDSCGQATACCLAYGLQCAGFQCLQAATCGYCYCCCTGCESGHAIRMCINGCCDDRTGTFLYHGCLQCTSCEKANDGSPESAEMIEPKRQLTIHYKVSGT